MKKPKAKKSNKDTIQRIRDAVQRMKRQKKIDRLDSSSEWKGLEQKNQTKNKVLINENINRFIMKFKGLYYSGRTMRFRDWLREIEDLVDELD